jgi:hypothetical protein
MNIAEAVAECEHWWAYLEQQKARAVEMQRLAALARTGPEGHAEALKRKRQIDTTSLVVYDGAKLCEATKVLVKLARSSVQGAVLIESPVHE